MKKKFTFLIIGMFVMSGCLNNDGNRQVILKSPEEKFADYVFTVISDFDMVVIPKQSNFAFIFKTEKIFNISFTEDANAIGEGIGGNKSVWFCNSATVKFKDGESVILDGDEPKFSSSNSVSYLVVKPINIGK